MERQPATNPANIDALGESPQILLLEQTIALKMDEKQAKNMANDVLSLLNKSLKIEVGCLNTFLRLNTRLIPALMMYPSVNESQKL